MPLQGGRDYHLSAGAFGEGGTALENTAEALFNYLKDILYEPGKATLDVAGLPADFQELGQGLVYFGESLNEMRTFAADLSKGNLSTPVPSQGNELAAPLKSLHASLKHLTWQSQQVAQGDYSQKVDFMGEFSEAFNEMIRQLDERQKALVAEIESSREKTLALEQSNSLFEAISLKISQCIVVQDATTGEDIFLNHAAADMLSCGDEDCVTLRTWLISQTAAMSGAEGGRTEELSLGGGGVLKVMSIASYPVKWRSRDAVAHVISDVSEEKLLVRELETVAFQDNLTQLYSRHYGMQVLRDWVERRRHFCLCFADMDNLKFVNDTYGHNEGDLYIMDAAALLKDFSRSVVACRLGGDEFMLLAEGWSEARAQERMQELRDILVSESGTGQLYQRSISFGLVEVRPDNDMSASELLSVADERMYRYKRAHKAQRRAAQ